MSKIKFLIPAVAFALGGVVAGHASAKTYTSGENAAGATVVSNSVSNEVVKANVSNISSHLDTLLSGGGFGGTFQSSLDSANGKTDLSLADTAAKSGLSAGGGTRSVSVWVNSSYTDVKNKKEGTKFDGDVVTVNAGIDKQFTPKVILGVSIGYANTDVDTTFNNGTYEEDAYTLAGYGLYKFTDHLNFAAMVGQTWSSVDQDRQDGTVKSSVDADTTFAAGTLNASQNFGKIGVLGRIGYTWGDRDTDSYTESDDNVVDATTSATNQGRVGGEVSYMLTGGSVNFTPYAKLDFLHDFEDEVNDDANAFDTGLGLRVGSLDGSVSGVFQVNTELGRDDFEKTTGSATLKIKF